MKQKVKYSLVIVAGAILLLWLFCLPGDLFSGVPYSTVVTDRKGELLGARVADDGQWRFPPSDTLPDKFVKALIEFEDRSFYYHPGVNVQSLARAAVQNFRNGRVVSGGSTITMQVIRLSRRESRTIWQKIIEIFMATRLELTYSKDEILRLYASHAPFGGNVVGIDAARWRYQGNCADISWAEAATFAVLQNAPSLIHLDRNRDALLAKRNRLLTRLHDKGEIGDEEYSLSIEEPLIGTPYPMPQYAPHYVEWCNKNHHGESTVTGIDIALQRRVEDLTDMWSEELHLSGIRDLSAVIIDVKRGEVLAYCGNSGMSHEREGMWVDIARSPRSSGSILKPLLYAAALQDGTILPKALLPDAPMDFGGFAPRNFDGSYTGAVAADEALSLSLNIPSVQLLKDYGVMRFAERLKQMGFTSLKRRADKYGLSLILGGAEVTLVDAVSCYAKMVACYTDTLAYKDFPLRDKVALYNAFVAMQNVNRPDQMDWRRVQSARKIAWKTGTSYGSRDAWAIGVTPEYAVGVWVGNADGSGAPSITGASTAGPIMFDLFNALPNTTWFDSPKQTDGVTMQVCKHSGYLAGMNCAECESMLLPGSSAKAPVCPYCKEVPVKQNSDNGLVKEFQKRFVLPPVMEQYYKINHHDYVPIAVGESLGNSERIMSIMYPQEGSVIMLPKQMDGSRGALVCKVAHTDNSTEIFWHLDANYLGSTTSIHEMKMTPSPGYHKITIVDSWGNQQSVSIIVK